MTAKEWATAEKLTDRLEFHCGSFTDLPSAIRGRRFSVIFSQVAFCHVHLELSSILENLKGCLAPGGILVINDYLGCDHPDGASASTREHCWKRLHFEHLHGHIAWRRIAEDAGYAILLYENLDRHMAQTYDDMAKTAEEHDVRSADGEALAVNYRQTAIAIRDGEIGMNLALMTAR